MSRGHVIHVCGGCCGACKREDTGCFGELGGLRASMSTRALWRWLLGQRWRIRCRTYPRQLRLRVSMALYGPGRRRSRWWTLLSAVDGSQREASSRLVVVVTAGGCAAGKADI